MLFNFFLITHNALGFFLFQINVDTSSLSSQFSILRKCQSKFDCLLYEMFFIKELKPSLNTQNDSIEAMLFT